MFLFGINLCMRDTVNCAQYLNDDCSIGIETIVTCALGTDLDPSYGCTSNNTSVNTERV